MKPDVKIWLLGMVALCLFALYYFSGIKVGNGEAELRKADFASLYTVDNPVAPPAPAEMTGDEAQAPRKHEPDTAQNILFIGDSMLEGLCKRFIDYADQNHHQLNTIIWYSSTTDVWANTDTLQYFLKKFDPSYVVVCLGGNELFVKDIPQRKANIQKMVDKIGDIPFVWISPPNWKEDTGINDAIISVVGWGRYFDSRSLELDRKKDHAHPTDPAAVIWMDTIARWLKSPACDNPLAMEWPENDLKMQNVTVLQPYYR